MIIQIQHRINGVVTGQPVRERRNPADTSDVVAVSAVASRQDVEDAVSAARAAAASWSATPSPARGRILMDAADLLTRRRGDVARDLVREEGKTLAEATGEVQRAVDLLRYHGSVGWRADGETLPSSVPSTLVFTRREPLGVVALITPWNFPIAIPTWKVAPALVAGNAVVLKPSELTPVSADHLADVLQAAGLPAGVLNVIHGDGAAGSALVAHEDVDAVSFTGSVATGARVRAAAEAHGARVQLEMGGKNPLIVLADADPGVAAGIAAAGGFGLTGQACTASSRVLVQEQIHDQFVEALKEQATRYAPGDGLSEGVLMGPVVTEEQLSSDMGYLETAAGEGGRLVTGEVRADGFALAPVVITDVLPDHVIAREEVFAPVVAVLRVSSLDDALIVANGSPYGLAAGLVTRDLRAAHDFAHRVQAGVVKINRPTSGLDLNVPFGGVKASSTNTFREQGPRAGDFYTWEKSVYVGWD